MGGATTELVERLLAYGASPNERVRANTQGRTATGSRRRSLGRGRPQRPRGRAALVAGADIRKVKNIGAGRHIARHTPLAWALARSCRPVRRALLGPFRGSDGQRGERGGGYLPAKCGADAWRRRDLVAEVGHDGVFDAADPVACIVQGLRDRAARRGGPFAAQIDVLVKLLAPYLSGDCGNTAVSLSSSYHPARTRNLRQSDSDPEPGTP